jgi:siroheme decarboxylase
MPEQNLRILRNVPPDLPIVERPYGVIADRIGMTEKGLIDVLKRLRQDGVIRRVAAILYYRRAAYTHNAMVVWKVSPGAVEAVGQAMARHPEVSHCYERSTGGYWDYNLYTMIHGKSMEECEGIVRRISEEVNVGEYRVLLSKREFKKTALVVADE